MKRPLLLSLGIVLAMVLILPTTAFAQATFAIDKGSLGISGTAGFTSQSGDLYEWDDKGITTISLMPSIFYFVAPNIAIGADVTFQSVTQGDDKVSMIGLGPKIMYAFGNQASTSYPYINAGYSFTTISNAGDIKSSSLKFGGGMFLLPANQQHLGIVIEAGILMDSRKIEGFDAVKGTTIAISVGLVGFIF